MEEKKKWILVIFWDQSKRKGLYFHNNYNNNRQKAPKHQRTTSSHFYCILGQARLTGLSMAQDGDSVQGLTHPVCLLLLCSICLPNLSSSSLLLRPHTNTLQEPDAHHQPHPPCWLKVPAPFSQGREHQYRLQEKPLWESWRIAKTVMLGGRGRGVVTAWSPAREARSDGWAQEKESSNTYCWAYLVHATVACSWKGLQWPGDWVMCCCAPLLPQGPWFLNVSD